MSLKYGPLLLVLLAAQELTLLQTIEFQLIPRIHSPISFARTATDVLVLTTSNNTLILAHYSLTAHSATFTNLGVGTRPTLVPMSSDFAVLRHIPGALHISVLTDTGEDLRSRSIPVIDPPHATLAVLMQDRIVVMWEDWGSDGDLWGIEGCVMDDHLGTVKSKFRVNSFTQGSQRGVSVAPLGDGFLAVWRSEGAKAGLYGQVFDLAGNKVYGEMTLSESLGITDCYFVRDSQLTLVVRMEDAGSLLHQIYVQRFTDTGLPASNLTRIPLRQIDASMSETAVSPVRELSDGSLLVAVNGRSWPQDAKSTKIARVAEPACVYFESQLSRALDEGFAVDIFSEELGLFEVTYVNQTKNVLAVLRFSHQVSSQCRQPQSLDAFPVAWQRIAIPSSHPHWKLIAIIVPLVAFVLILVLFAVTVKACLRQQASRQRLSPPAADMSAIDKSVDSVSPLNSINRVAATLSAQSRISGLNSMDMPDIIADARDSRRPLHRENKEFVRETR